MRTIKEVIEDMKAKGAYTSEVSRMTVKEIRAITGLSQRKFAEKYGLNKRTLQNWEGGANRPPQGFEKLLLRAVLDDQEREAQREGQLKLIEQELYEPNPEPEQEAAEEVKDTISRTEKELLKEMKKSLEEIDIEELYCENCIHGKECDEDYIKCDCYHEHYRACDCIQNWIFWETLEKMTE